MTKPDYERAATKAAETLVKYKVITMPVMPLLILKQLPNTVFLSYAEISHRNHMDRTDLLSMMGDANHDALTYVDLESGKQPLYIVAYNQRLPYYMIQRALARELGHIILEHDGSRPESIRNDEAKAFAYHLLCPRGMVSALRDFGIPVTVETIGTITGCYERCLAGMRKMPGVTVPAELNRQVKEQFAMYLESFMPFQKFLSMDDESALVDFGTYMDNYIE